MSPRCRTPVVVLVLLAALGAATAACGVPVDSRPAALSKHGIPFGLLDPARPPPPPPPRRRRSKSPCRST